MNDQRYATQYKSGCDKDPPKEKQAARILIWKMIEKLQRKGENYERN